MEDNQKTIDDLVKKFVIELFNEYYYEELSSSNFIKKNDNDKAISIKRGTKNLTINFRKLVTYIINKDPKLIFLNYLNKCNNCYRKIFEDITELKLPSDNNETETFLIEKYIGHDTYNDYQEKVRVENEEIENKKREEELRKYYKLFFSLVRDVKNNNFIYSDELLFLIKHYGIKINSQTAKLIDKRVIEIKQGNCKIRLRKGKTPCIDEVHRAYNEVLQKILIDYPPLIETIKSEDCTC